LDSSVRGRFVSLWIALGFRKRALANSVRGVGFGGVFAFVKRKVVRVWWWNVLTWQLPTRFRLWTEGTAVAEAAVAITSSQLAITIINIP
jgi:hypothetical protein